MKVMVSFSGGAQSWAAAKLARELYPDAEGELVFADTRAEDEDTYRFLHAAAENVGGWPLVILDQGIGLWELFRKERFLANSRFDLCSRKLKREPLDRHWKAHYGEDDVHVIGIGWEEVHRLDRLRSRKPDGNWVAPLVDRLMGRKDILAWAMREGLPEQRLYEKGMPHANCGGGCVKAGRGHFLRLLETFPERFSEWEHEEQKTLAVIGQPKRGLLRDRRNGQTDVFYTLQDLREEVEADAEAAQQGRFDFGGCGCALD